MISDLILLDITPPIATLTLNRPQRHNSLIPEMLEALLSALQTIEANEDVKVVVLQANGRSFSTGGDVKAFYLQRANLEAYANEIVGLLNKVIMAMMHLSVPVVTAVHGIVTGGSLGLVLAGDIVLIAPKATITPWYSVVGFSPDGGWTAMLPAIIGAQRTASILMQNSAITAKKAVRWGIAGRIVPAKKIHAEAQKVAQTVAAMKPGSIRHTHQLLADLQPNLGMRLEAERIHFVHQIMTEEALNGMAAFLNVERK